MMRFSNLFNSIGAKLALGYLMLIFLIALFSGVIADHKPLYVNYNGQHLFPALTAKKVISVNDPEGATLKVNNDLTDWQELGATAIISAPIPYSANTIDYKNTNFSAPALSDPVNSNTHYHARHILGTDKLGRDVLSGIIHGAGVSLTVGFLSMLLALSLGLFFGCIAGFYGDHKLHLKKGTALLLLLSLFFAWFYAFKIRSGSITEALQNSSFNGFSEIMYALFIAALIISVFMALGNFASRINFLSKKVSVPIDTFVSKTVEIFVSVPKLILIITVAAIFKSSIALLILIIGLSSWTEIARIVRAEFLRIRELDYMTAGKAAGNSDLNLILKHALPNAISPALVAFTFGVASAIIVESSLSFLGIGVPRDQVTWGSLLAMGSTNFKAWWMIIFPGAAIFSTVFSLNVIAEKLNRHKISSDQ